MTQEIMTFPAIALRGLTILPGMITHFDVSRDRSKEAVHAAMRGDQKLFLVSQKEIGTEDPGIRDLYSIGTVAAVKQVIKLQKDMLRILVEGEERADLLTIDQEIPYLKVKVMTAQEEKSNLPDPVREAMIRTIRDLFHQYSIENSKLSKELVTDVLKEEKLEPLLTRIASDLPMPYQKRQKYLEAGSLEERYEVLGGILENEIEVIKVTSDLQRRLKEKIDKHQKEYILREQLKLIKEELGESESVESQSDEFLKKLEELNASDEVKNKIRKEILRYKGIQSSSPESTVLHGYLDTVLALPWDKRSEDSDDLKRAWEILEEGHYGLKDVKERIMEFLAVRQLTGKGKSPILCLVGPPGTGKTSIARSVAEALNKKYVRICLGGVRDEAEIRGHRKTYVGAMAGRITVALKEVGVGNPLMLLDEIDKTSGDHKGDTASALLEVLDPEQNNRFNDHYVEIPQDLSEVLFIATANDRNGIPRPLLDRMELIEISGYTENEKLHIAKEHLLPKQLKENGIPEDVLTIEDSALRRIINHYTRESGVRNLERTIGRICRKTARDILEKDAKDICVTAENLSDYLGKERRQILMANKTDEIGIARGLAWTQVGGDTLEIEVNILPGKGDLLLTGQLGDVMKESARTGISYLRSIAADYGVDKEFFRENDIHVHIPEGAVPKDGPSAGITMATAMLSAIAGIPVCADLAMTGEISLRGRVLAIGGLKEKLLAAKYAGIKRVLVPEDNRPDIEEMDAEILDGLQVSFVSHMTEVLKAALRK
ncbi:MAG: endopeptidase La [Clostridiales bacterium]|nr:endopeptidase La [Candidatus Blautia equi]